jgi:DNA-binding YbaB/EbfC family protein
MQQAQKMQEQIKQAQEDLAGIEVTGQSGGGVVKIEMNGRMEARRVRIDPTALSDPEMLEDLIVAAINDAVNKVQEASRARMAEATAGMPLPPGMNLGGMF